MQANSFRLRERKIGVDFKGGEITGKSDRRCGLVPASDHGLGFMFSVGRGSINWRGRFSAGSRLCVVVLTGWALQSGRRLRYAVAFGSLKNGMWKQEDKS